MADDKQSNENQSVNTGDASKDAPVKEAPKAAEKKPAETPKPKEESKPSEEQTAGKEKQVTGSVVETEGSLKKEEPKPVAKAAVVEAPAPAPAPAPVPNVQPTLQVNDADASVLEMFNHRVDEYIDAMKRGKPVSPEVGAGWQKKFLATIEQILKLEGTVFFKAWSNLLAKVAAERDGVFAETHAFRFVDRMGLAKAQMRQFTLLVHLIIQTADPKGRQQMLKMIEITRVTEGLRIPGASDRLYAYYKL